MATIDLRFSDSLNASLQVGDTVYFANTTTVGGFITTLDGNSQTDNPYTRIGIVKEITQASFTIKVTIDPNTLTSATIPTLTGNLPFIFFSKDNVVNMSTPLGYYAKVTLKNNSTTESELFSIGCDTFESSK